MKSVVLSSVLFLLCVSRSYSSLIGRDHQANQFVTAYPQNNQFADLSTIRLHVTTTELQPVSFNVTFSISDPITGTVNPGETVTVRIPFELTVTSINKLDRAVLIKAEENKTIAVYSSNNAATSVGAFSVLPLHHYDINTYTYYAISSGSMSANRFSTVLLVSGSQPINVTVTPTHSVTLPDAITGSGDTVLQPDEPFEFTMQPLQTVLLQNQLDLTGTKISSNLPLAVISGHQCGNVPIGLEHCDHIVQQIPPVNTWGFNYMSLPFPSGSVYNVMAAANNTSILITCNNVGESTVNISSLSLQSGQWLEHITSSDAWCSLVANGPILVTQFAKGGQQMNIGDPMSLVLTPLNQFTDVSSLVIPTSLYQGQIIDIVAQIFVKAAINISAINVTVDGQLVTSWSSLYSGTILVGHAANVTGLSTGAHIITSSTPIPMSINVFGYTNNDAYGYPLNGGLDTITTISSPLLVEFSQANYSLSEGEEHYLSIIRQNRIDERADLLIQGCNGIPIPGNVVITQTSIAFEGGQSSKNVELTILDDQELSQEICFCVELVQPNHIYTFLFPYSRTNICIKDNEDVHIHVTDVIVNEANNNLRLDLSLTGYQGDTDMMIIVHPKIVQSEGQPQVSVPALSFFNVYFTKYLTTSSYTLSLTNLIPINSFLVIDIVDTMLNINSTTVPVQITFPSLIISSSTTSPSPSTINPTIDTITSVSPTHSITSSTLSFTFYPSSTVTSPVAESYSGFIRSNSNIIFPLLASVIGILALLILILIILAIYQVRRRRFHSVDFKQSELDLKLSEEITSSTKSDSASSSIKRLSEYSNNSYNSTELAQDHRTTHQLDTNSPSCSCHNSSDKLFESPV